MRGKRQETMEAEHKKMKKNENVKSFRSARDHNNMSFASKLPTTRKGEREPEANVEIHQKHHLQHKQGRQGGRNDGNFDWVSDPHTQRKKRSGERVESRIDRLCNG